MQDRGPELARAIAILLALATLAVSVRCYVRVFLTKSFGYDDWLMVATLFLFFLNSLFLLVGVHNGIGHRTADLTPDGFSAAMKMWFFAEIFYVLSSTFTKLAAGALLLRLTTKRLHIQIIWFIMIIAMLFGLAFVAEIISQCHPTAFFWSPTRDPLQGHCINAQITVGFTFAHAAVSSLGDWTFGILPAFIVRDLKMNFRTKVSVFLVLCLANVGSIATLIRMGAIHQLAISQNFLFSAVDLAIWSSVEVGIAITAASFATYRPLIRTFLARGSTVNRSVGMPSDPHHFNNSTYFPHGPLQNIPFDHINRDDKAPLSQISSADTFGRAESTREV